jgi:hypothetical protein
MHETHWILKFEISIASILILPYELRKMSALLGLFGGTTSDSGITPPWLACDFPFRFLLFRSSSLHNIYQTGKLSSLGSQIPCD